MIVKSAREKDVLNAIQSIRGFHALGCEVLKKGVQGEKSGRFIIVMEAKRLKLHSERVRKARQFADATMGYAMRELEELCNSILQVQSKQKEGRPIFKPSHILRLLTVEKNKRYKFQKEAIENAWSIDQLDEQLAIRFGPRRSGGRRKHPAGDTIELLMQAEKMREQWRRWELAIDPKKSAKEVVLDRRSEKRTKQVLFDDLPGEIPELVREAGDKLISLQEAVTICLKVLKPNRTIRLYFRDTLNDEDGRKSRRSNSRSSRSRKS
jgi:hypothetical protein